MTTSHQGQGAVPRRFKLLRGGLAEASATDDRDWQDFCLHIGWQQPPDAPADDDYEDTLVDKLFGTSTAQTMQQAEALDNVIPLVSGAYLINADAPAPWSLPRENRPRENRPRENRPRENSRRSRARWTLVLPWVAAVAVAVSAGVLGAALSQRGTPEATNAIPVPVPDMSTLPAPHAATPAPVETVTPAPPPPHASEPDPGSRRAQAPSPLRHRRAQAVAQAESAPAVAEQDDAMQWHAHAARSRVHSFGRSAHSFGFDGLNPDGLTDSSKLRPGAFAALRPAPPLNPDWDAPRDALALTSAKIGAEPPAMTSPAPWRLASAWYQLALSAPREPAGPPAGVRMLAQIDLAAAGRRLFR